MVGYILLTILILLIAFLAVLTIRAARFQPKPGPSVMEGEEQFDKDRSVSCLQELVRCKTISYHDPALEDDGEFEKLIAMLPNLYPNVFKICRFDRMPDRGLLFQWSGKTPGDPAVLMAHYDVVPVNEDGWEKPPFAGVLEEGVLWGRGTLDTKGTFNGVLFAADHLIAQGFVPEHDVYFAFSGGEEISGLGAIHIVNWFKEQGITPSLVLDEGGAVVENVFPGVKRPCGLIGIAEKGYLDVKYTTRSAGGHASAPKPHTPVGILSRACCKMESHPFRGHLTRPVAELFDTLGRHSSFVVKLLFANLWCFGKVLDLVCRKSGGDLNALMRTTVAFTQMEGSSASNVIPPEASMVCNMRLNPADTVDSALEYIRKTVNDPAVEVSVVYGINPSRLSRIDCEGWNKVASSVASTWKGCIVAPYLMMQCSDSRHYDAISDKVYRFSAMDLTREERGTIHGHNERVRVETVHRAVEFYIRLMKQC